MRAFVIGALILAGYLALVDIGRTLPDCRPWPGTEFCGEGPE